MSDSRESWIGSRRALPKELGLRILKNTAESTLVGGIIVLAGVDYFLINHAIYQLHHQGAVRDAEALAKLQEQFTNASRTQLAYIGNFDSLDAVQGVDANAFFTVPNHNPDEGKYQKTLYIVTNEDYHVLPERVDDDEPDRFVFLNFSDDTGFFENFDYEHTVQTVQDIFPEQEIDPSHLQKQVLAVTISASGYGRMEDIDSLLMGGFDILYAEGISTRSSRDMLGVSSIQDGTQRVYTVPQFTY